MLIRYITCRIGQHMSSWRFVGFFLGVGFFFILVGAVFDGPAWCQYAGFIIMCFGCVPGMWVYLLTLCTRVNRDYERFVRYESKLVVCPECKCRPFVEVGLKHGKYRVVCRKCYEWDTRGPYETAEDAIGAWNDRYSSK